MIIQAPYPALNDTIVLPEPELGDQSSLIHLINSRRAMSGTKYTYVKKSNEESYNFSFTVTRMKSLEFLDFFRSWHGKNWKITNYDGVDIIGVCKTNPIAVKPFSLYGYCPDTVHGSEEIVSFEFEFEGLPQ